METTELKNPAVHQLNITYQPIEDRLLLKIGLSNATEIVLWLTRRLTKMLWQLLSDTPLINSLATHTYSAKDQQMAQELTKSAISQKLDANSQYQPRQSMNNGELFLVSECQLIKTADKQLTLEMLCTNKKAVKLGLNDQLLIALTNVLEKGIQQSTWELTVTNQPPVLSSNTAKSLLH